MAAKGDLGKGKAIAEGVKNIITANLLNDSPMPTSCCIFRVPQVLRRHKEEAYTPDIVSIGPFHRGGKFQAMENVKHWYLQGLLSRIDNASLDSLINEVSKHDKRARNCYADPLDHLDQIDFVHMLVVDGCFLLELFRKADDINLRDKNDPIFYEACMLAYLYHDLLLLENQLPWFVLECLYDLTGKSPNTQSSSLVELVLNYFRGSVAYDRIFSSKVKILPNYEVLHILDFVRTMIVLPFTESHKKEKKRKNHSNEGMIEPALAQRIPCATSLTKAGVKLGKKPSPCILDIDFQDGKLMIPSLVIDETTAPLFRNLIALEQCHYSCRHYITSYAVVMGNLMDSGKDVDLLCKKGILGNWLNDEDAAIFFKDLYYDTTVIGYCYGDLSNDVIRYHNTKWNMWKQKFRTEFSISSWDLSNFICTLLFLYIAVLHTVFTIQQADK